MAAAKTLLDYAITVERESTYGTNPDTAPIIIPTAELPGFTIEPKAHRFNRLMGYRAQHEEGAWQDTNGSIPTATLTTLVTPQIAHILFPAILQKAADWTDATNLWTLYSVVSGSDFPAPVVSNEGYFYTIVKRAAEFDDNDEIFSGAVASAMTLSISPTDNDGVLFASFDFFGSAYTRESNSGVVGSVAALTNLFKHEDISLFSVGEDTLTTNLTNATFNITNGAKLVGDRVGGEVVFPKFEVSGSFSVRADANTEDLKDACESTAPDGGMLITLAFTDDTPDAAGELVIKVFAILKSWSVEIDLGEVVTFEFDGVLGDTESSEYPISIAYFYQE